MLFAAKIQADKADHIKAHLSGTLVLTNFTLEEGSPAASIYLLTSKGHQVLIVALSERTLAAYHTQLRIDLSPNAIQVLFSKNGAVHVLGHFIPHDLSRDIISIDEAISIKTKEKAKESQPQAEPSKWSEQESEKPELKEKDGETDTAPRRSLRARTPAPTPKQSSKPKKQIKFSSGSKGKKSLLEMMYTLNDEDQDDESEYSEEEQSSSSSSSSVEKENDSDQTPKASGKKEQKSQKIQSKKDSNQPLKQEKEVQKPNKNLINASQILATSSIPTPSSEEEQKKHKETDSQNLQGIKVDEEVQKEISYCINRLSKVLTLKVLESLPPKPTEVTAYTIPDKDNDEGKTYKEIWFLKYHQIILFYQRKAIKLLMDTQEARQNETLVEACKLQAELKSVKATLMKARKGIEEIAQQSKALKQKRHQSQENGFQYRMPNSIPKFALQK